MPPAGPGIGALLLGPGPPRLFPGPPVPFVPFVPLPFVPPPLGCRLLLFPPCPVGRPEEGVLGRELPIPAGRPVVGGAPGSSSPLLKQTAFVWSNSSTPHLPPSRSTAPTSFIRSEERRVGGEC